MNRNKRIIAVVLLIVSCFVFSGCSSGSSYSRSSSRKGAGGYDMPNSSDKSFTDYMKRVDPGLYNSLIGN